ncbi:MAG TPA: DUF2461 domain-containing protein [Streptosporangiaceae bacterium]|nr:DUF2461 domain-containing protein [Streptosporangiaceae bacterium]
MAFAGWPAEALEFYEGLEADNTRSYWLAHREVYETQVRGPMDELLAELAPEFGEPKVFRPYRDVRFSKDKSPYKTAIAARLGDGYVQLSARGLAAGTGMYQMAPGQLERYRQAVAADVPGGELQRVVSAIRERGIEVHGREVLKTAPRGFPADHERIDLLRCKGLIAWQEWPAAAWLGTPEARQRVAGFLTAARPLAHWLADHVGPPAEAERRSR